MPPPPLFRILRRYGLALLAGLVLLPAAPAKPADWAAEIAALTAQDATQSPPAGAVVFVGSSSIRLWETLAADFPGLPLVQRGFGGSELADSVYYADRIVLAYHPRLVVLYAGENDIANGASAESVATAFTAFCAKVHTAQPGVRILFVSLKPSPSRVKFLPEFARANTLIAAACARDPRLTFVDVFHPMLNAAGAPRPELFRADQLHMLHDGYLIWVRLLAPLLQP
ncbi:MAG: SGNH/GDSL hydrolase family protein [Tepidisphaerales bacterium]